MRSARASYPRRGLNLVDFPGIARQSSLRLFFYVVVEGGGCSGTHVEAVNETKYLIDRFGAVCSSVLCLRDSGIWKKSKSGRSRTDFSASARSLASGRYKQNILF